jgi:hypothetical protein
VAREGAGSERGLDVTPVAAGARGGGAVRGCVLRGGVTARDGAAGGVRGAAVRGGVADRDGGVGRRDDADGRGSGERVGACTTGARRSVDGTHPDPGDVLPRGTAVRVGCDVLVGGAVRVVEPLRGVPRGSSRVTVAALRGCAVRSAEYSRDGRRRGSDE